MSTPANAVFGLATGSADQHEYNTTYLQILAALTKVQTLSIVEVIAIADSELTVKVIVNLLTGNGQAVQHGEIYGIPFVRTQGGPNAIICDPQPGDLGLCGFCSRDIASVKAAKGPANPGSARLFDWADGVYIGALSLLNASPSQFIQFLGGSVLIQSPMVQTSGNLSVGTGYTGTITDVTGTVFTVQNGIVTNAS